MDLSESFDNNTSINSSINAANTSFYRKSQMVDKGLEIYLQKKINRNSLKWGSINTFILSIILYDIKHKCPYSFSNWYYVEYTAAALLGLSVLYYLIRFIYYWLTFEPLKGTSEQRKLLHFNEGDRSFVVKSTEKKNQSDVSSTPLNATTISWHSSSNDANRNASLLPYNRSPTPPNQQSFNSPNYPYHMQNSFNSTISSCPSNNTTFNSPYKTYSKDEVITDEHGLQKYLKEVAKEESNTPGSLNFSDIRDSIDRNNSINTLWNYCNNAANVLKTSIYQLSPTAVASSQKQPTGKEYMGASIGPGCSNLEGVSETMKIISPIKLTKYVTNLRMWISSTILQRLVKEFDKINNEFNIRGFSDIKIGAVGLERLKKTAEHHMIATHVPTLPIIIPFLEMSTNQEYLVQRIRELAKGSGINDYRWNSSNSFDINWDEHVTTDAAIIFHLFCTYMDSQLMPLPQPGGRPFNRYVVWGDKKTPKEIVEEVKARTKCAIMVTNPAKPKFNFISDDKIHNCNHERNNLFCVIIHFLIYMRDRNSGLLDGVNLGRSGLNVLCVIDD